MRFGTLVFDRPKGPQTGMYFCGCSWVILFESSCCCLGMRDLLNRSPCRLLSFVGTACRFESSSLAGAPSLSFEQISNQCAYEDVKELEFVSALMQTDKVLRPDGTLKPQDVTLFLQSRFGLAVDEETVERLIFKDLAGWVCSFGRCLVKRRYRMDLTSSSSRFPL